MKPTSVAKIAFLSLMTSFAPMAANSNGNVAKFNRSAEYVDNTKPLSSPEVSKGSFADAKKASENKRLAIHIYGSKDSEKSAEEYATILVNAFADRRFTDKPMYITVTHEEATDLKGPSRTVILMDRVQRSFGGTDVFTPEQVGGAIQVIGDRFVKEFGSHMVIPEDVKPIAVATL